MNTKTCTKCSTTKPIEEFGKRKVSKVSKDGLRHECKACASKAAKLYYEIYSDRIRARSKIWSDANPDKKLAHGKAHRSRLTQAERAAEQLVDNTRARSELSNTDLYGGLTYKEAIAYSLPFTTERLRLEAETGIKHEVDHIVPIAAGGLHTVDNLRVITKSANQTKTASDKLLAAQYNSIAA